MLHGKTAFVLRGMILLVSPAWLASCSSVNPPPSVDAPGARVETASPADPTGAESPQGSDPNATVRAEGPLRLGVQDAILLAMENNPSLVVEKMNPQIMRTFEQQQRAIFDPVIIAEGSSRRILADRLGRAGSSTESSTVDAATGVISLAKLFPTGTTVGLEGSTTYTDSSLYSDTFTANRLGLTVTQALLQGRDVRANMARVDQARLDALISEYELRGFMELLVEQVESKFWDYALARRQIEIYTDSLALAEKQMAEIQERITWGNLAETELAAAQAEVALRRENLINARSRLAKERLELLRLVDSPLEIDWDRDIILEYDTAPPEAELDAVEDHVEVALRMRPDMNQARLHVQRGDLEIVRTRNGLLPRMDAFITFGKTGYADTFPKAASNIGGDSYDASFGVIFQDTWGHRAARAEHTRAVVGARQVREALKNLAQLVQVDVRSGYVEVLRAREQITATAATRSFQEEKLRAETEKFRVGKSTSLLVGQAQRDLVASQIAEIEALANYVKALAALYRMEGSLLQRRGIAAPGGQPVTLGSRIERVR